MNHSYFPINKQPISNAIYISIEEYFINVLRIQTTSITTTLYIKSKPCASSIK